MKVNRGRRPVSFLTGEEYLAAPSDPVSVDSRKMLATFNSGNNPRVLERMCFEYAGEKVKEAFMFHIDRYGFSVLAKSTRVGYCQHLQLS
jgi:hypothetical protein